MVTVSPTVREDCEKLCTWVEAILEGATDSLSWWRSRCWCAVHAYLQACIPTSMQLHKGNRCTSLLTELGY